MLVFFAGVVSKLGAYGFIRFALTLFPGEMERYRFVLAGFAVLSIIYGALMALSERDLKRIVAYASISHLGFIALGIFSLTDNGINGAVIQIINHGIIISALFLIVGYVEARTGTRDLGELSGLERRMPWLYFFFLVATLAGLGMPGMNSFVGEFTIMLGAFQLNWVYAVARRWRGDPRRLVHASPPPGTHARSSQAANRGCARPAHRRGAVAGAARRDDDLHRAVSQANHRCLHGIGEHVRQPHTTRRVEPGHPVMLIAASPVPLSFPGGRDLVGILPELVLGGAFLLLMLLDLVVPASRRTWLAGFALLGIAATFGVTIWAWFDANPGRLVYSGSFAYDRFALFVDAILLVSAGLVVMISPNYLNRRGLHYGEYYALILAATLGMMLLAGATSLMVIFLAIELLSLALYVLSGFSRHEERSQEAALKYLLLGGFASGFLLFGMALIYGETGHTQLAQIAAAIQSQTTITVDPLLLAGVLLLFIGFAFKVSAAPFHSWTPDVYQGAPTSVTTFMSVTTKVAAFAALVRVFTYTFDGGGTHFYQHWEPVVALVAITSMVVGNIAALTQTSVKRMLAYSGIAQAGYILIGVAVGPVLLPSGQTSSFGTIGVLYYLAAYAVSNIGAFAVITVMAGRGEDLDSYDGLRGLAHRRPFVAASMALFLFSLGGFPPTAGFFGKFLVFTAAINAGQVPLALWGIATSAVSAFYYLRVGLLMYQRPAVGAAEYRWSRTGFSGSAVLVATTAGTLILGVMIVLVYTAATASLKGLIV